MPHGTGLASRRVAGQGRASRDPGLCRGGAPGSVAEAGSILALVGARHLGEAHPRVLAEAKRLAEAAGVALLCLRYTGPGEGARLTGAAVWPERPDAALPAAIESYFYPARRQRASAAARP